MTLPFTCRFIFNDELFSQSTDCFLTVPLLLYVLLLNTFSLSSNETHQVKG